MVYRSVSSCHSSCTLYYSMNYVLVSPWPSDRQWRFLLGVVITFRRTANIMVLWDVTPCCLVYRYLLLPSSEPDNIASRPKIHCCKNIIAQDYSLHSFFLHLYLSLSKHGEQEKINRFPLQQKANLCISQWKGQSLLQIICIIIF